MDEIREKVIDALCWRAEESAEVIAERILALLPTEGEPGEPVAWMVKWGDYTELFTDRDRARYHHAHWQRQPDNQPVSLTPLYTTPQESAEAERFRSAWNMTKGQITEAIAILTDGTGYERAHVVEILRAALNTETDG